ncbi:hypothetical protein PENSPDRAFT_621400 [Peniophora sp. CONT]|nr:hypothetical protein PENSPDRAFT_621400 [Peniophora sp. CONT]
MASSTKAACKYLVLDAGPLLSLSPLRGLAETYVTVPQVLDELKDKRAREHFEQLALTAGVNVKVMSPDAAALAHVVQFAKKTGDYAVLSHPDLAVLALTHALDVQAKEEAEKAVTAQEGTTIEPAVLETEAPTASAPEDQTEAPQPLEEEGEVEALEKPETDGEALEDVEDREPLNVELHPLPKDDDESSDPVPGPSTPPAEPSATDEVPIFDDPSDEDDGEGEWITPSNVSLHKSKAMGLTLSDADSKKHAVPETLPVACMTTDFAMQNVLLQMGLNLVGVEGRRIDKVKTWVLRCHACFKICKDNSKKFCPACGNPSLLRTSVTVSSPDAKSGDGPALQVHLKKNFQYRTRGTIYSIPAPKPGSAKKGSNGIILREDQPEYQRAVQRAEAKRERDERKMFASGGGAGAAGSWMDPDWVPDILTAGASGKGRKQKDDLPVVGYGRRNPNERKHHKK